MTTRRAYAATLAFSIMDSSHLIIDSSEDIVIVRFLDAELVDDVGRILA